MSTTSSSDVYALGRFVYEIIKSRMANSITGASLTDEEMMKSPLDLGTPEEIWKQRLPESASAALYNDKVHGSQLQRFRPDQQYEISGISPSLTRPLGIGWIC